MLENNIKTYKCTEHNMTEEKRIAQEKSKRIRAKRNKTMQN